MTTSPNNQQPDPAIKEQPVAQAPAANYQQPTPEQQQTPYNQQPVQQQYFAQPNAAPVQYVVQAASLKGVRGWLAFFMVIAGLSALGFVGSFINVISNFDSSLIADVIFLPLLIAASIAAVVTIALEKNIARFVYIGYGALLLTYNAINSAVKDSEPAVVVGGVLTGGLWLTFIALYFISSKRVKETLVK